MSPSVPIGLASAGLRTGGIDLVWTGPAASTGSAVTGYIVYRNDGAGGSELSTVACNGTGSTVAACSVSGLSGGQEYVLAVSALSVSGEGDRSSTLAASTSPAATSGLSGTGQTTD